MPVRSRNGLALTGAYFAVRDGVGFYPRRKHGGPRLFTSEPEAKNYWQEIFRIGRSLKWNLRVVSVWLEEVRAK